MPGGCDRSADDHSTQGAWLAGALAEARNLVAARDSREGHILHYEPLQLRHWFGVRAAPHGRDRDDSDAS